MQSVQQERKRLTNRFFPEGIPELWCPMIVHYDREGRIDTARMEAHLKDLCSSVHCFLLFGSTGDGWELRDTEKLELLSLCIELAAKYHFQMLLGVLQPEKGATLAEMQRWIAWMKEHAGCYDLLDAMQKCHVCGFTVCAHRGATLPQEEIQEELEKLLQIGAPMALYQLPQITLNEISPQTLCTLAHTYPNFYLFKDTSGTDKAALSSLDFDGVFFVRGAEGEYEHWFYESGGRYDGFLLSSANCFGRELNQVISLLHQKEGIQAQSLSNQISAVVGKIFDNTASLNGGNVFANANKCMDQIRAYGQDWEGQQLPMRHCGEKIPLPYISFAAEALKETGWFPEKGYLFC